jgi:hypothetical protein
MYDLPPPGNANSSRAQPRNLPIRGLRTVEGQGFSPAINDRAQRDTTLPEAVAKPAAQRHSAAAASVN